MNYYYFHQSFCNVNAYPFEANSLKWETSTRSFFCFLNNTKGVFDPRGISYALYKFLKSENFKCKIYIDFYEFQKIHKNFEHLGIHKNELRKNKTYVMEDRLKENQLEICFQFPFSNLNKSNSLSFDLIVVYDFHKLPDHKAEPFVEIVMPNMIGLKNCRVLILGERSKTESYIWKSFISSSYIGNSFTTDYDPIFSEQKEEKIILPVKESASRNIPEFLPSVKKPVPLKPVPPRVKSLKEIINQLNPPTSKN